MGSNLWTTLSSFSYYWSSNWLSISIFMEMTYEIEDDEDELCEIESEIDFDEENDT